MLISSQTWIQVPGDASVSVMLTFPHYPEGQQVNGSNKNLISLWMNLSFSNHFKENLNNKNPSCI